MNGFVEMMTEKDTLTENGAITNSTSHNYNLDLFFLAGACRNESEKNINILLNNAWNEGDKILTLKTIFWAGDIRQGAGERRFFKIALTWLYNNHKEEFYKYLDKVPEFSRWDVLFDITATSKDEKILDYICTEIKNGNALLCKWMPRKSVVRDRKTVDSVYIVKQEGTNSEEVRKKVTKTTKVVKRKLYNGLCKQVYKHLGWTEKELRKWLAAHSNTVEQKMCAKQWNEIQYKSVPSVALNKYTQAWYRNDEERFTKYIEDVKSGKEKINASAIFPHDIIRKVSWCDGFTESQIAQWNNLPNYLENCADNMFIPICDVSGSMEGTPMNISIALGLYLSERNVGPFKDAFIVFSDESEFMYLKGDINSRMEQMQEIGFVSNNTNLLAAFDNILEKAIEYKLSESEMPKNILIISDMEFDECGRLTNYDAVKSRYFMAGYKVPNIIFWNVNGRTRNIPITVNDQGVALISGASPSIVKAVLTGEISPIKIMLNVLNTERYSFIHV